MKSELEKDKSILVFDFLFCYLKLILKHFNSNECLGSYY